MSFKEWDECLKFLEVLTKWPPIVLLMVVLFRHAIAKKIMDLKQITIEDKAAIVFATVDAMKKTAVKTGAVQFKHIMLSLAPSAIMNGAAKTNPVKDRNGKEANIVKALSVEDDGSDVSAEAEQTELAKQLNAIIYQSERQSK